MTERIIPSARIDQTYVSVAAIEGGSITLPERFFVAPANPDAKRTVPSLCFLITHPSFRSSEIGWKPSHDAPFRMLFDLGLRSEYGRYLPEQQKHLDHRSPYELQPGVAKTIESGGVSTRDIDTVMLSHVHYDHHGDPENFPASQFVVGSGALHVLEHGLGGIATHQHFEADLLRSDRTTELTSPVSRQATSDDNQQVQGAFPLSQAPWQPFGPLQATQDIFQDGSVYIIHAPGHLPGHLNLLCRTAPAKWVYLAADACHDRRILTGEKQIGTWKNEQGAELCIHLDREGAKRTIQSIRDLQDVMRAEGQDLEVILAHDDEWWAANKGARSFPNTL
ncbi:MAG: hypothetical protein M1828_004026 [Chrysothrix sp. TS-e1954]|nr:MAG: hypothetical protein M1828_004026 [Chrysothrix sp. TS-e1954]